MVSGEVGIGVASFGLGVLHALEPGHGKTALAAYLLGNRKNYAHAVLIAVSSAAAHLLVIVMLAAATHLLVHHVGIRGVSSQALMHGVEWIASLMIVAIGTILLYQDIFTLKQSCCHCEHNAPGIKYKKQTGYMSILIGVGTGLMPCPTAVAAFLNVIPAGDFGVGMVNLALFSAGMFVALMAIIVLVGELGQRVGVDGAGQKWNRQIRLARSFVIVTIGCIQVVHCWTAAGV